MSDDKREMARTTDLHTKYFEGIRDFPQRNQMLVGNGVYRRFYLENQSMLCMEDTKARLSFCNEMLRLIRLIPDFLEKVIFTHVFNFSRNEDFPLMDQQEHDKKKQQHQFGLNTLCVVIGNTAVRPIILPNKLTEEVYCKFLKDTLMNTVEQLGMDINSLWYQQSKLLQSSREVCMALDEQFPNRWIGRKGFIQSPPRSPDLNLIESFLGNFLYDHIYNGAEKDIAELGSKIQEAFIRIKPEMLANARDNLVKRLKLCIICNGNRFEHLL